MNVLLTVGIAIILGFTGGKLAKQLKIPMVTGWVIMGVIFGGSILGVFREDILQKVEIISDLALGIIAFSIGGELTVSNLKRLGKSIAVIVICESTGAFLFVSIITFLISRQLYTALILGAVASATAPAATVMVINEVKAKGDLTTIIISVVAIDDAMALIIYAFASSFAKIFISSGATITLGAVFINPIKEILGALFIGFIIGLLISLLGRWMRSRSDFFTLMVGAILLSLGLSSHFHLSALLTNMALGMTVANFAPRSSRSISNTWQIVTPFLYIAFFCLAGAHLNIKLLPQIGLIGLAYTGARMAGKICGASLGAKLSHAPQVVQKYIGFSLFSQVGVALALAIVVGRDFGGYGTAGKYLAVMVINILLFTTVITETVGPYLTRRALIRSGEVRERKI